MHEITVSVKFTLLKLAHISQVRLIYIEFIYTHVHAGAEFVLL